MNISKALRRALGAASSFPGEPVEDGHAKSRAPGTIILATIVFGFGIVPAAGGAIVWKTFQIAKITNFTYPQCWKAYLAGCGYGYVACMIVNFIEGSQQASGVLQLILFCTIPFLVVPLLLRNFSSRVLAAEVIALLIADGLVLLFVLLSSWH